MISLNENLHTDHKAVILKLIAFYLLDTIHWIFCLFLWHKNALCQLKKLNCIKVTASLSVLWTCLSSEWLFVSPEFSSLFDSLVTFGLLFRLSVLVNSLCQIDSILIQASSWDAHPAWFSASSLHRLHRSLLSSSRQTFSSLFFLFLVEESSFSSVSFVVWIRILLLLLLKREGLFHL